MNRNSVPLIMVVPELYRRTGGVQVFSRNFLRSVDQLVGRKVPLISMNDRISDLPSDVFEGRKVAVSGDWPVKMRGIKFAASILRYSLTGRFLSTHPNASRLLGLLNRIFNTPFLVVAHGVDVWDIRRNSLKEGLRRATKVLPVSRFTRDRITEQLGQPYPKFFVFPNEVDTARFFPGEETTGWREKLRIPKGAYVALSVARLECTEERKGYDLVLEVVENLVKDYPKFYWILAGTGDDLERMCCRASTLGISNNCRFPGFIESSELADLYRSADVFVLPSKKEGFGIVFLEAAACGLPVIAGNKDGSVDALGGGEFGQLIDPDSHDEIERALRIVIGGSSKVPFQGNPVGLHHAISEKFGCEQFEKRLETVLNDLGWL